MDRTYELDFGCLKREVLSLQEKLSAEQDAASRAIHELDRLRCQKDPKQQRLRAQHSQIRDTLLEQRIRAKQLVPVHVEKRYQALLNECRTKAAIRRDTELKIQHLRMQRCDTKRKLDEIHEEMRVLRTQLPAKKHSEQKYKLDLLNIKEEQYRKLIQEASRLRTALEDRTLSTRLLHERIQFEHTATAKEHQNLTGMLNDSRAKQDEEENRYRCQLNQTRRSQNEAHARRARQYQEQGQILTDLNARAQRLTMEETDAVSKTCSLRNRKATCERRLRELANEQEYYAKEIHQILCDYDVVKPLVQRITQGFRQLRTDLDKKLASAESDAQKQINAEILGLTALQEQLNAQDETAKTIKDKADALQTRLQETRAKQEKTEHDLKTKSGKIDHIKRCSTLTRPRVNELAQWKQKMQDVGVTPQCYFKRLQARLQSVATELQNAKRTILKQAEETSERPKSRRTVVDYLPAPLLSVADEILHQSTDKQMIDALAEAFTSENSVEPLPETSIDDCYAVCKRYLFQEDPHCRLCP